MFNKSRPYIFVMHNLDILKRSLFRLLIAGITMLLVLFSEKLASKFKVFTGKHFYVHKHDYRNDWLKFNSYLTSCRTITDMQNVILNTYRETFDLKGASLYLLDREERRYSLAANHGMPDGDVGLPTSTGLIAYFAERCRVFNPLNDEYIPNAEEASFVCHTGARLIVPLSSNGNVDGFVILGERLVQGNFIYEDYDLMKTIGKQAILPIINFKLSEELAETREIAAVAKISSFVVHDLKNLTSNLSLLLDNARDYIGEPEFREDMIETIRNTVTEMKEIGRAHV